MTRESDEVRWRGDCCDQRRYIYYAENLRPHAFHCLSSRVSLLVLVQVGWKPGDQPYTVWKVSPISGKQCISVTKTNRSALNSNVSLLFSEVCETYNRYWEECGVGNVTVYTDRCSLKQHGATFSYSLATWIGMKVHVQLMIWFRKAQYATFCDVISTYDNGYLVFPGGKAAGAWCWPPAPF
jgi:hypothetical protein